MKKLYIVIAILICAVLLTGCSGESESEEIGFVGQIIKYIITGNSDDSSMEEGNQSNDTNVDLIPEHIEIPAIENMGYSLDSVAEDGKTVRKETSDNDNRIFFSYIMTRTSEPYDGKTDEIETRVSVEMGIASEEYSMFDEYEYGNMIYNEIQDTSQQIIENNIDNDILLNEVSNEKILVVEEDDWSHYKGGWINVLSYERTNTSFLKLQIWAAKEKDYQTIIQSVQQYYYNWIENS